MSDIIIGEDGVERIECLYCQKEKGLRQFYRSSSEKYPDGYVTQCKSCLQEQLGTITNEEVKNVLVIMDKPFLVREWGSCLDEAKKKKQGRDKAFGYYLRDLGKNAYINLRFKDSLTDLEMERDEMNNAIPLVQLTSDARNTLINKWGDYNDKDLQELENKFIKLLPYTSTDPTALHKEHLMTYCKYQLKADKAILQDDADGAKKWGDLASKQASSAKLNISQLKSSDFNQGLKGFGELSRLVEESIEIIPYLPQFQALPQDAIDFAIYEFLNYSRALMGMPEIEYEDVYHHFQTRIEELTDPKENPLADRYKALFKEMNIKTRTGKKKIKYYDYMPKVRELQQAHPENKFYRHLHKWVEFVSWAKFYPDLFYDLIREEKGGMRLDADQRFLMRCMARFKYVMGVFSRGFGKCVDGDTLIPTSKGYDTINNILKIEENSLIEEVFETLDLEVADKFGNLQSSTKGVYTGYKDAIRITTESGFEICGSYIHPILVQEENESILYKKLHNIKTNDKVVLQANYDVYNKETNDNLDLFRLKEGWFYLLGIVYNLGYDKKTGQLYVNDKFFNKLKDNKNLYMKNNKLFLNRLFLQEINSYENNKKVPKIILQANREEILSFVKGILSTSKLRKNYYIINTDLDLSTLKLLTFDLGYNSILTDNRLKVNRKKRKKPNNYVFEKVVDKEFTKEHLYDLYVPNTNSFLGNGFVNHNTMLQLMINHHDAIFTPNRNLLMTAQTEDQASTLVTEKYDEIIKFFPMLKDEVKETKFSKSKSIIYYNSGSTLDTTGNKQSAKGLRRHKLTIEESAQVDTKTYKDALEPIVNVPRNTIGENVYINPYENNGSLHRFTTSWYKGSSEYETSLKMIKDMLDLKDTMVLGGSWRLPNKFGRGEPRSAILKKQSEGSYMDFAMNYLSRWVGVVDGALIPIERVLATRTLEVAETRSIRDNDEYYMGVDVARSNKGGANTIASIIKVKRSETNKIKGLQLVNMFLLDATDNFADTALEIYGLQKRFNARMVVIDGNGAGTGLVDVLTKEMFDPITRDSLGCWKVVNDDDHPFDLSSAKPLIYSIKANDTINHDININFINVIEQNILQLLVKKTYNATYDKLSEEEINTKLAPYIQTDILIEEVSNLKAQELKNRRIQVVRQTTTIEKDRFSSLAYVLYYIMYNENDNRNSKGDATKYLFIN